MKKFPAKPDSDAGEEAVYRQKYKKKERLPSKYNEFSYDI